MGTITIKKITNLDQCFYPTLGSFLSKRNIVKELGNSVWDDDGKIWYVALDENAVAGFVAAIDSGKSVTFCSDYVLPKHRNEGVYSALFSARLADFRCRDVVATATGMSLGRYLENRFEESGTKGKYHVVRRRADNE